MAIIPTQCELCIRDDDISQMEIDYLEKTISAEQCIAQLGTKPYTWRNHIKNHVKPQVAIQLANRGELVDVIVDKVGEVVRGLDDLKEVMAGLKQQVLTSSDPNLLKVYLAALAEVRHHTETLQKLQGDFKDSGKINVQNMHVEYNQLVGSIMQYSCPKCKPVFADKLAGVIKKVENENDSNKT
jgi:hypothetical protein